MLKQAECVLVIAQQAPLRAAVAQLVLPLGYRVEIASSEKTARALMRNERFAAAVVAPASLAAREPQFLREVQGAVQKLVVLADGANDAKRFVSSFPEALVCASQPLEAEKLLAFLGSPTPPQASARNTASAPELAHFEGWTLDVTGRALLDVNRREVALTHGEFALLLAFARNPGRVLSRDQLRNAMDGGSADAYDRSIDMLVARLRRKIEPDAAKPKFIVTMPGAGYKFVPRVHSGKPATVPQPDSPGQISAKREAQHAERRQLTVLACQILGFAALAAELDPEDLEEVIRPAYATCAEVMARFNGTMVRAAGDSLLAYFGHPKSDENDAESAVRAALDLLRVIGKIEAAPIGRFRARIGIATGLMVIGELSSIGTKEPTAIGEALNLALHMQKSAPAGSVLIAASTRDLIGRFFQCREIEPVEMEEGHKPAPAWRVIEEMPGLSRFEALRRDGMPELVSREGELDRLSQAWVKAQRGSGQVVLLRGEAGIGKSRLVFALEERLRLEPHAAIRYSGSPYRIEAPMSVLLDELQRSAGFAPGDAPPQKLEKLRRDFAALGPAATAATALIAGLLGLPFEAPPDISQLSPQKRKERTFAALLARIESMAAQQPVLAVVEDIHWVDPTSLEFITLLVERASALHLLLVIVGRPEFAPPWPEHSYVTALALSRLSRSDAAALIQQVAGNCRIPAPVEALIVARADGVPLFVEELTKAVLERGASSNGPLRAYETDAAQSIPTTLHGLLLVRFDRLEQGKEVAQAGAVIGREFSYELLRMITAVDERAIAGALDQLVASGLIFRRGTPPQASYVFKHALVRDAAYAMLLRAKRQRLHAEVARVYEEHFSEIAAAQPELLAHHHSEAGNVEKAIRYLAKASQRARLSYANFEAINHLKMAIELLLTLPESTERDQAEIDLQISLGATYTEAKGFAAPEVEATYARAWALSQRLTDTQRLLAVVRGLWIFHLARADWPRTHEFANRLLVHSQDQNDTSFRVEAHRAKGVTLLWLGDLASAREHLERGRLLYSCTDHDAHVLRYGSDAGVSCLVHEAYALWALGYPDRALTSSDEALTLARELRDPFSLAQALLYRSFLHRHRREAELAKSFAEEAGLLAEQHGFPFWQSESTIVAGWARAQLGEVSEGLMQARHGFENFLSTGARMDRPRWLATLAEVYGMSGRTEDALQTISDALTAAYAAGERFYESPLHCLKGTLLQRGSPADFSDAEASLRKSIEVARGQQAKGWELQAALTLARALKTRCNKRKARQELAPVYEWFKEGLDTPDLKEAAALLNELE